ncbi:FAD-dependent monooxygenase [Chelativorans sp. YIM 93263]|uniref:FAD-dependent monooxygenase n=1 Tax=Chelativorans sp. YIM 93263 TaxID=2906648 RepID=UPI0023780807|nr:FAD-dependent monooxygenase [Chelativorans sp. YIM 93263]
MTDHTVIIAGGGPTGLMLGAELTLAGVDVVIIKKRVNKERIQPGALGPMRARLRCSISAWSGRGRRGPLRSFHHLVRTAVVDINGEVSPRLPRRHPA